MIGYTIAELAEALAAKAVGDLSFSVTRLSEPASAGETELAVAMEPKFVAELSRGRAQAAILSDGTDWQSLGLKAALLVDRPRVAMARLTQKFLGVSHNNPVIHPAAIVDPSAKIGARVTVGPFSVIEAGALIGDDAVIGNQVTISVGALIGTNAIIQTGVHIGPNVVIGDNFIAHPGVVIGADGFSFVTAEPSAMEKARKSLGDVGEGNSEQPWIKIHSLGGVLIGDDVEIGANSSVDAGTIRATSIGSGTKFDAHVHVGHNVEVGRNCLLCAQVGIGGSARVGDYVVLGGQVGVADNITIGDGVIAGGASKILSNVPKGRAILGYPAVKMKTHVESYKALRRLPRLFRDVENLRRTVSKEDDNT
jgi:UDP-3-O-[3-hydroxymyristoyl] glucosamine N-acyltransferase